MYDCVKFTERGWQVAENFCENVDMPFVCKASGTVLVLKSVVTRSSLCSV